MIASMTDENRAASLANPHDMPCAAATFFDRTVNALACHVTDDPTMLSCFVAAILALSVTDQGALVDHLITVPGRRDG